VIYRDWRGWALGGAALACLACSAALEWEGMGKYVSIGLSVAAVICAALSRPFRAKEER
jgi:hypothetical protein